MFKCSGCGLCCHHVDKAIEATKTYPEFEFPYSWDASGKCEKLSSDNKCTVYEDRPLLCNIDKIVEIFDLDKVKFYNMNAKVCNQLMDDAGTDLSFRI